MASGGEGHGEPPAGDYLQTVYRFWLVGHRLSGGGAPWLDPYGFQPLVGEQTVLGGWPFGFAFWKKFFPAMPSGNRVIISGRSFRYGSSHGETAR